MQRFKFCLEKLSSLLIIRLRSLGDTVLMTPVVSALKRWRTDLNLSVLIEKPFAAVLQGNPHIDDLIILDNTSARSKIQLIGALRRRRYDAILNLHGGTTSLLFSLLTPAKYKIGFNYYRYSQFYNLNVPDSKLIWRRDSLHTVEHQLAPLKWLGVPMPASIELNLFVQQESRARMAARLMRSGLQDKNFVLIHPSATLFTKQWDINKFATLVDYLIETHKLPVVLTVSQSEKEIANQIKTKAKQPFVVFDNLELDELIALIDQAFLFIGCDSGPTHIAAALRKKVVVIFGSSNHTAWRPWNTSYQIVKSDLPCIPCPGDRCYEFSEPMCINQISVRDVIRALEKMISHEAVKTG